MSECNFLFDTGDYVNVVFTGREYDAFIPHVTIRAMIKNNPHRIVAVHRVFNAESVRYVLESSRNRWPPNLLELSHHDRKPDWVI